MRSPPRPRPPRQGRQSDRPHRPCDLPGGGRGSAGVRQSGQHGQALEPHHGQSREGAEGSPVTSKYHHLTLSLSNDQDIVLLEITSKCLIACQVLLRTKDLVLVRPCQSHSVSQLTCAKLKSPLCVTGSRGSERTVRIWNVEVNL